MTDEAPYELIDEQMQLVVGPRARLWEFCEKHKPKLHYSNLHKLLHSSIFVSRLGWDSSVVQGLRLKASIKWIRRVGFDDDPTPVPLWSVATFIERVASKSDAMIGLQHSIHMTLICIARHLFQFKNATSL